ncbi:MAG TPA: hypothetical protein VKY59_11310 [Spirillospora sp.]|nr:hypothetical protein [Spirillospora sp.]
MWGLLWRWLALISGLAFGVITLVLTGRCCLAGHLLAFAGFDGDIYLSDISRHWTRNLTRSPSQAAQPVWSPDGQHIAYLARSDAGWEVYLMNAAGGDIRRLPVDSTPGLRTIAWSPDGRWLAYTAQSGGANDIYLLDMHSGAARNLTQHPAEDQGPAWSPDSQQILFTSYRTGDAEIFVMDIDCDDPPCPAHNLTRNPAVDTLPQWSPDGTMIAYLSNRDGGDYDVFIQPLAGGTARNVSRTHLDDAQPEWFPDGTKLLWLSPYNERYDRRVVIGNLAGEHERTLADLNGNITSAKWSPDGRYIALAYTAEAIRSIYVVNVRDGRWHIVAGGMDGHSPAWQSH